MLLYHYFYTDILRVKKFNSIIINNVNKKDFFININRFKTMKNIIFMDFINEQMVGIALNRAIIIGFIMLRLKTIARRKEIELFDLLRKFEINIILKRDKRFLKKAKEARKAKEIS